MWQFKNPVKIISGSNSLSSLRELIHSRSYGIVTYDNDIFDAYTQDVISAVGYQPSLILNGVIENPHIENLTELCFELVSMYCEY